MSKIYLSKQACEFSQYLSQGKLADDAPMLKQNLSQKLLQKLSPQQIQFIKLLQLNSQDFEQKVEQEILDNPALEKGKEEAEKSEDKDEWEDKNDLDDLSEFMLNSDDYNGGFRLNEDYNDEQKEIPIASSVTFHELLMKQASSRYFTDREYQLATHLIGSIEEDGYLRRDLAAIVNDLAFSENVQTTEDELEKILIKIQNFDPPGIGARDLQECLLLQLYKKDTGDNPAIDLAQNILSDHFEAFTKKHYTKILKSLKIGENELKEAIAEITKLNPKPGQTSGDMVRSQYIIPDFIVKNRDGEIEVMLNSRNAPELRVSRSYSETLQAYDKSKVKDKRMKESVQFIKQKLEGAKWFIDSIKQRQNTLLSTMNAIIEMQRGYFEDGDETELKPMILKDIADRVGLDISTISRVANSKYVETDFGIIPLKFFFSEGIVNSEGEEVSNREVKKILSVAVENEDKKKPLTDEKLMNILKEKGYNIARRTVAKYREQLNIPVARLRKQL